MFNVPENARTPMHAQDGAVVAELVWRALHDPHGFSHVGPELEVTGARPGDVKAVLPLLEDVRIEDWVGESGTCYRDYVGALPCGLLLRLITDAGLAADVCGGSR
ncbi:hypothetical protein JQS43_21265 [Natronosporangium hydrolyticum]|uniref:Uncharacterized protein n=1 Tax=Natronosporangium hydrolyticum TaxID=2811111 RepID=A0A895YCY0_9ACTN|nr:hypothetical protein [Natronosporangium hydrolyticum]QSB14042.1 hypothetical protein JQS43_21265 [Natronosporangium hydrolyticum]